MKQINWYKLNGGTGHAHGQNLRGGGTIHGAGVWCACGMDRAPGRDDMKRRMITGRYRGALEVDSPLDGKPDLPCFLVSVYPVKTVER